jgi:hypothetical protein
MDRTSSGPLMRCRKAAVDKPRDASAAVATFDSRLGIPNEGRAAYTGQWADGSTRHEDFPSR